MSNLFLAAALKISSGDLSTAQAEAVARRDEATLSGERASEFFDAQRKATGRALVNCGVTEAHQASGLRVVMRLDAQGRVTKTWLNKQSELGLCFEKELQSATFPTYGWSEFYTFTGFSF